MARIRVLIVDDSAVVRRLVRSALDADPEIEVVGEAGDGREALERLAVLEPDAMVCDVEMPVMSGIETVQAVRKKWRDLPVVMFASPNRDSAHITLEALHAGASDFVMKPVAAAGTSMAATVEALRAELGGKIKGLLRGPGDLSAVARAAVRHAPPPRPATPEPAGSDSSAQRPAAPAAPGQPDSSAQRPAAPAAPGQPDSSAQRPVAPAAPGQPDSAARRPTIRAAPGGGDSSARRPAVPAPRRPVRDEPRAAPLRPRSAAGRCEAVVIAVSTGGPNALAEVVPRLPADLGVPVLVVQHMPPVFTRLLAERLGAHANLAVREAAQGDVVQAGTVWLAPGDHHLTVRREGTEIRCALNRDPPENSVRPAADVLLRSAAQVWGGNVLVVVMTGMGQDGLLGAVQLSALGAPVLAQDEASSVVWGMPGAVAKAGIAERLVPLPQLADSIAMRVRGMR